MQLNFRIILNVKEDVLRDIVIDSATSLLEFSNIISSEFGFDSSEISTFHKTCLLYTSPSPRDLDLSRMPSSA